MSLPSFVLEQLARHSGTVRQLLLSGEGAFNMTPIVRTSIIATAFAAVVVLAAIGWVRKPTPVPVYNAGYAWDPNGAAAQANAPAMTPGTPVTYADQRTGPYTEAGAANPCVQPVAYAAPSYASRTGVRTVRQRVVEEQPRGYADRTEVRRRGRSTGKSVAIVAGSAGVGAAIGALAGGGKGAAIGALAGGGGGFVYDRLTHNH
jgi:uncharacterized protein YcfJ